MVKLVKLANGLLICNEAVGERYAPKSQQYQIYNAVCISPKSREHFVYSVVFTIKIKGYTTPMVYGERSFHGP